MKISSSALKIPLKGSFKQASHIRYTGESIWIEVSRGRVTGLGEGCPRTYVTHESLKDAVAWLNKMGNSIRKECSNVMKLRAFVVHNQSEIDRHPAAWCAMELALLDLFAKESKYNVENLLNIENRKSTFEYTAILSDDDRNEFLTKIERFKHLGFKHYKVKISGNAERDQQKFEDLTRCIKGDKTTIRIDANNFWGENLEKAQRYFEATDLNCLGVEEPFKTGEFEKMAILQQQLQIPIILDESGAKITDLEKADATGARFILNLKISKAGGIFRSLALIDAAKSLGMKIIVGAHVGETSLLTRAAMLAAQYSGDALLGQEGGFGEYLIKRDKVKPILQVGKGGLIDLTHFDLHPFGWGLEINQEHS
jgi:L-alanine-DL-glutamate epimerase-like enolase superfamily enzyme